jgi:hypothetical protein
MPNLKPFRDYNEHDVINIFTVTGQTLLSKGTFVTVASSGVNLRDESVVNNLSIYGNSVSALFTPAWSVAPAPSGTLKASVVGATLKDFRTLDENGEVLLFHPRKAAEMDVIISGQAMPVVTKGLFLYSGIATGNGQPAFGTGFAVADAGDGSIKTVNYYSTGTANGVASSSNVLGKFLGPINTDGYALIKIEL